MLAATDRRFRLTLRRAAATAIAAAGLLALAPPPLAADGADDPILNGNGRQQVDASTLGFDDYAGAIAVQPNGRIVLAGEVVKTVTHGNVTDTSYGIVRLRNTGVPDAGFGANGIVTVDFGAAGSFDTAQSVALQPDGKIVVCGLAAQAAGEEWSNKLGVVRLNVDGTRDTTFGGGDGVFDGALVYQLPGGDMASSCHVLVLRSGKLLLTPGNVSGHDALARLNANGTVDTGFGLSGASETLPFVGLAASLVETFELPDGKLLSVGGSNSNTGWIARYTADGFFDDAQEAAVAPFGAPGGEWMMVRDAVLDNSGRLVILFSTPSTPSWLLRMNGLQLDPTFGLVNTGLPVGLTALAVQPDGKPLLAGSVTIGPQTDFRVTRWRADGIAVDSAFDGAGTRTIAFVGADDDVVHGVAFAGGTVVLGGLATSLAGDWDFAVARLTVNPLWSDGFESGSTVFWSAVR